MDKKLIFNALSKQEVGVISRLSFYGKELTSIEDIKRFLPSDYKYTKQLIYKLKKKRFLPLLKRVFTYLMILGDCLMADKLIHMW
jgi:hypothetical protein